VTTAECISVALRPPVHRVLGVTLRPFAIGHWLHMQSMGLSWVTGKEPILDDLLLGILACASSHANFSDDVRRGGIARAVKAWGLRLSGGRFGAFRRWVRRVVFRQFIYPDEIVGFDFQSECAAFQRYIDEHGGSGSLVNEWAIPITSSTQPDGRPLDTPWPLVLLDAITTSGLMEIDEALDAPVSAVRWRWAIHAERTGSVRIISLGDWKADQQAANEFASRN
jgi:hypothetical protein